jgi:DNA invertase Pin-like site-specific DNA recombinase
VINGSARVSTCGQTLAAQRVLTRAEGCTRIYRETASGAQADCREVLRMLECVAPGDVVTVTRIDRLARSTRDLLNTLNTITERQAGFQSLDDAWADTTTAHGRLMES